ncbi:unnamed protein product (mitochondrion) [Plasmodiophora brassicae]|uniref:Uncharacterized protein n=1 Tax=Plasmodiophora brassicae TaxID=37360 RepID=A8E086_PLABS|nr:hypothetical protein [Plasmodiophora brassicae]CEP03841.1 hypothetical protein PBRA_003448 [Plasmodiophora brassicae]SPQ99797.1 unnamed protein product [Plasmodiophora brassicae]
MQRTLLRHGLKSALSSLQTDLAGSSLKIALAPADGLANLSSVLATARAAAPGDPLSRVSDRVSFVIDDVVSSFSGRLPLLASVSKLLFESGGKRLRPSLCLLMAGALSPARRDPSAAIGPVDKVAQISEMIHVASLLHDDVLDGATTRRNTPTANVQFGDKASILGGDFLLSRSSIILASLGSCEAVSLMATIISDLVSGEIMQMRPMNVGSLSDRLEYYLSKSYRKTASLMANSCRTVAVIDDLSSDLQNAAMDFGKYLGLCFQLTDDLLDITGTDKSLGKPSGLDLSTGVATAPVLFAAEQYPELNDMMGRKFSEVGDVDNALEFIRLSDGIERTRELIRSLAAMACQALDPFPTSVFRDSLVVLVDNIIKRDS